ncbi:hypothetical protein IMZ48_25535 [Candidatus Bathyarchaeota archaeon]|nr:hypothetical protein [Candidatus Bathyarchaeota archaeon]
MLCLPRVLGIDIGSTSTRLCLYCPTSGNEVEVDAGFVGDPNRFEPGDFSTSCYPFDNGYAYIGNKPGRGRLATSLKPVFLLRCDLDEHDLEPLIAEYPHSKELLSRIRQPGHIVFRRKLTTAVRNFFDCLGKRTIEACEHYGFKITAVGISDPGQWPAAVEDYMADMFLENFNRGPRSPHFPIARDNVFFHGETQALAHFFFRPHANNPRVFHSKTGVFLLADFGGQNLVRRNTLSESLPMPI